MPSSATTRNRFELQAAGENNNAWGPKANNVFSMIDAALDGMASFTLSGAKELSSDDYEDSEANKRYLNVTGGTGGTITIPDVEKWYFVRNGTSGNVVITTGSGTSATVPSGATALVLSEGANLCRLVDFTLDPDLLAIAALTSAANKLPYATGAGAWAMADFSSFGRTLAALADAAAGLTALGAAPVASPTLTGTPAAPTASEGTATTQIATTAFVDRLRNVPVTTKTGAFTFSTTERGGHVKYTGSAAAATINPNGTTALGDGFVCTITNLGSGALTITRGSGVTLRWAGSGSASTNANRTLAVGGQATISKLDTNEYIISGAGLS